MEDAKNAGLSNPLLLFTFIKNTKNQKNTPPLTLDFVFYISIYFTTKIEFSINMLFYDANMTSEHDELHKQCDNCQKLSIELENLDISYHRLQTEFEEMKQFMLALSKENERLRNDSIAMAIQEQMDRDFAQRSEQEDKIRCGLLPPIGVREYTLEERKEHERLNEEYIRNLNIVQ